MAAISPFTFVAGFDGKTPLPELISPEQAMSAFEDALASMLGSQAASANGTAPAEPILGLPTGPRSSLDPPLSGVPSGTDSAEKTPDIAIAAAAIEGSEAVREEPASEDPDGDEELLVNPHACFVTLPWSPPAQRASTPDLANASAAAGMSAESVAASPRAPTSKSLQPQAENPRGDSTRRSTLRFPPPPPEALQMAARELAAMPAGSPPSGPERPAPHPEATPVSSAQHAAPPTSAHATTRTIEPGFVVAPTFLEGGRIEWTVATPAAPANDTHRSMSYAVAAAEHDQRTVRAEPRASAKRERTAVVDAAQPAVVDAIDRSEPEKEIAPVVEAAKAAAPVTATAAEAPAFMAHAQPVRSDAVVEPRALAGAAPQSELRSEASRERRQDDAEVTVSQMTLSHRVEARTVVDDLGAITVRAEARHGQVEVSVVAERVETTAFLDLNRADLSRELKLSAPNVSDVSVRTGDGSSGSSAFDQRSPSGREQHAQRQPNHDWAAGTPSSMAAATGSDTRAISANGKRVRIVL